MSYQYKAIQVPILKGRILGGNLDIQEIQIVWIMMEKTVRRVKLKDFKKSIHNTADVCGTPLFTSWNKVVKGRDDAWLWAAILYWHGLAGPWMRVRIGHKPWNHGICDEDLWFSLAPLISIKQKSFWGLKDRNGQRNLIHRILRTTSLPPQCINLKRR